jgi:hypothetical protein
MVPGRKIMYLLSNHLIWTPSHQSPCPICRIIYMRNELVAAWAHSSQWWRYSRFSILIFHTRNTSGQAPQTKSKQVSKKKKIEREIEREKRAQG